MNILESTKIEFEIECYRMDNESSQNIFARLNHTEEHYVVELYYEDLKQMFFHRDHLNLDQQTMWDKAKRLFIKGDQFWEIVINPDMCIIPLKRTIIKGKDKGHRFHLFLLDNETETVEEYKFN